MTISHDLDVWGAMYTSIGTYITERDKEQFDNAISLNNSKRVFDSGSQRDNDTDKPLVNHLDAYVRLRYGYLLREGANKYGKNNWRLGQPTEAALESLHRHLAKFELGCVEEDHLSAIIFNVQLIMKNEEKQGVKANHFFNGSKESK